jgi:hypothetical protein
MPTFLKELAECNRSGLGAESKKVIRCAGQPGIHIRGDVRCLTEAAVQEL